MKGPIPIRYRAFHYWENLTGEPPVNPLASSKPCRTASRTTRRGWLWSLRGRETGKNLFRLLSPTIGALQRVPPHLLFGSSQKFSHIFDIDIHKLAFFSSLFRKWRASCSCLSQAGVIRQSSKNSSWKDLATDFFNENFLNLNLNLSLRLSWDDLVTCFFNRLLNSVGSHCLCIIETDLPFLEVYFDILNSFYLTQCLLDWHHTMLTTHPFDL